jgi:hypothetical protein
VERAEVLAKLFNVVSGTAERLSLLLVLIARRWRQPRRLSSADKRSLCSLIDECARLLLSSNRGDVNHLRYFGLFRDYFSEIADLGNYVAVDGRFYPSRFAAAIDEAHAFLRHIHVDVAAAKEFQPPYPDPGVIFKPDWLQEHWGEIPWLVAPGYLTETFAEDVKVLPARISQERPRALRLLRTIDRSIRPTTAPPTVDQVRRYLSSELETDAEHARVGNEPGAANSEPRKRPCYDRDHAFLKWYEADDDSTHHSHAGIRDKWNALSKQERAQICSTCVSQVRRPSVIAAVRKAKAEQQAKKS